MHEEQYEVLKDLDPVVRQLMDRHERGRKSWSSSDFLPASEGNDCGDEENIIELRRRARTISDPVRVVLSLNIRTEEGLPHFHRILSKAAKPNSALGAWNGQWTAEEHVHECVLRDYVRDTRLFDLRSHDRQQSEYVRAGFNPVWSGDSFSPYCIFTYTSLQEKATQISHLRTGNAAKNDEPILAKILQRIAEDEARHYAFYVSLFKAILERDPSGALAAAGLILPHIDMPGVSMADFKNYLEVAARMGVYALRDYLAVMMEVIRFWNVGGITHLDEVGERAQRTIMDLPARVARLAERLERSRAEKSFSFEVIYNRGFIL